MPHQLWLAEVARRCGLNVKEIDGWQTRGKEAFDPEGTICHHTGGGDGEMPSLGVLLRGRSDLPPPLANYGLGRSGTVYVVAAGRANHAGVGTFKGLSGNSHFIGIEAENKGGAGDPWPAVQLDAYYRLCAAIELRLKRDASFVGGHKEYATPKGRKNDPHTLNMDDFRKHVAAFMNSTIPQQEQWLMNSTFMITPDGKGIIAISADKMTAKMFADGDEFYLLTAMGFCKAHNPANDQERMQQPVFNFLTRK